MISLSKIKTFTLVSTFLSLSILLIVSKVYSFKPDREVVALVGGKKIYKSQLERRLEEISTQTNNHITVESLNPEMLKAIILEIYSSNKIYKLARTKNIHQKKYIRKKVAEFKKRVVNKEYIDNFIVQEVSLKEAMEAYNKLKQDTKGKEERRISHILLSSEDDADRVRRDLVRRPNKFASIAKNKSLDKGTSSLGGDLGYVLAGELVPEFSEIAFMLKNNSISKPFKTEFGWHIIKINDVRDVELKSFEDSQESIVQSIEEGKLRDFLTNLTNVNIKIYEPTTYTDEVDNIREDNDSNDIENEVGDYVDEDFESEEDL